MKGSRVFILTFSVLLIFNGFGLHDQIQNIIYSAKSALYAWAGETKISHGKPSNREYNILEYKLCPGDIILTRQSGYLSNIFIPGFWTHAVLYIGSEEERSKILDSSLNNLIPDEKDIIEALSEGVVYSSLENYLKSQGLAIIRPHLSNEDLSMAIGRACKLVGSSYDFNFDLNTEEKIYCTELIYKSFIPIIEFTTDNLFGQAYLSAKHLYNQSLTSSPENGKLELIHIIKM